MAPLLLYVGQGNETREHSICATGASSGHGPLTISLDPTYPLTILLEQLSGFGYMQKNPFKPRENVVYHLCSKILNIVSHSAL